MISRFQNKRTILGDYAEELVFNFLSTKGDVRYSSDPYDEEKDLIFENHNVEVKARTRIFKSPIPNTFPIEQNQWKKLDNPSTKTIFVNIPMSKTEQIHLYFLSDKSAFSVTNFKNKSDQIRFYHIHRMYDAHTISDKKIIEGFYDLNFSSYKHV